MRKKPVPRKRIKHLTDTHKKKILPVLIKLLKTATGKKKAIAHWQIKNYLRNTLHVEVPVRTVSMLIHHLRVTGTVKRLVGANEGFYIARSKADGEAYIRRLSGYIKEMQDTRKALKNQFDL